MRAARCVAGQALPHNRPRICQRRCKGLFRSCISPFQMTAGLPSRTAGEHTMNAAMIRAFAALEAHRAAIAATPLGQRFADDPGRFAEVLHRLRRFPARLFQEPDRRRGDGPPAGAGGSRGGREAPRCHVRRRADQRDGKSPRPACGAARARATRSTSAEGQNVVPMVHEVLDRMAAFAEGVRSGAIAGPGRQVHRCGQYRHRRLRSRTGDGDAGAGALP